MTKLLVRKSENPRVLQDIGEGFYRVPAANEAAPDVGAKLLALSRIRLTWWQRHAGLGLSPNEHFGRLLLLHRLAFEAELAGQSRRADFFWREAFRSLQRIWKRDDVWEAVRSIVGGDAVPTPRAVRDLVATELFIDTHIAFANGRLGQGTPLKADDRLFAHLAFIRLLLKLQQLPVDVAAPLLAPAIDAEIGNLESESKWDVAISRLREYIALCPGDLPSEERLAGLYFKRAIGRLSAGEGKGSANAASLRETMKPLDQMRRECPDCAVVYDYLGHLHHIQSIQLANGKELATALLASRKAQILAPGLDAAATTLSQLAEAMTKLQTDMREVEQRVRAGGVTLNAEGSRLRRQANLGFSLLDQFDKSAEPAQLAKERVLARARKLWRDVGLAPDAGSEDKTSALSQVVGELYSSEATTAESLAERFREASAENPALSDIPAERVGEFIVTRRRENAGEVVAVADDRAAPAGAFSISGPVAPARRDREPLWYWLLGRQDPATRVLAALAGVAVIPWPGSPPSMPAG
jgi:hypothetical protein